MDTPTVNANGPPADAAPAGPPPTHVVGVGASAGGLEALERLFEDMPRETGLAFVVVQHLSPDFKSLTDELLARRTRIPIFPVRDGMAVHADAIYLLPPKKDMIFSGGRLLLTDKEPGQYVALPIDHFFRSLAQELGQRAVGVVLSGTGSDGSRGVREVRAAGGLVIAQSPESAKFDGMPRSAVETGAVNLVMSPEEMPAALLRHARHPAAPAAPDPAPSEVPHGMAEIFRLLRDCYGIDFAQYKSDTVSRRVERRLVLNDSPGIDEYARRLAQNPAELNLLYKDLLIGVTQFFRDQEAFARLEQEVLPELIDALGPGDEFRAWVAGCATGEEAYSLAILVLECMASRGRSCPVRIFATDVHRSSLEAGGVGCYDGSSLADAGAERLARYFTPKGDGAFQVSADLRKSVVFAPHNVLKDAPFTRLDLVSCRNLLIYFQPGAQKKVLSLFHFALKTRGVLFLGPSESPGDLADEFDAVDVRWRLYRKRRDVRLPTDIRPAAVSPARVLPAGTAHGPAGAVLDPKLLGSYDALLDARLPPSVLVGEGREVIQSFAGASRFLRPRDGRFSVDVLEMVDPELRMALAGALPRAFKEAAPILYKGLRVQGPDGESVVDLTVRPVRNRRGAVAHCLVEFEELGAAPPPAADAREIDLGQASKEQLLTLEAELRHTKENLQALIEELETSNEELQATNEELVASNEELQSTNEELHSVNEELYTVNGEYQKKIAELTELTTDMDNLLTSTEVHTIFLDRELCIRKFTPKIAETFNLLPQDVGRRIDHFTYTIDHPGLLADLKAVLETARPLERQVRDRRGNWFLLRVLPYRVGLSVEGVVLTLIDLGQVKQVEAQARLKDNQLAGILRNSPNWIFIKDLNGRYVVADDAFRRFARTDPVGKTAYDLFPPDVAHAMTSGDDRVRTTGVEDESEITIPFPDGPHTLLATKFPVREESGRIIGVGVIKTDVTQLKRAEGRAREAVGQRDRFLAMLSHELRNPMAAVLNATRLIDKAGVGPEAAEWVRVIERRSRHMARLLDDLLDVSRVTGSKLELRKVRFDLAGTVADAVEEVRPWLEERGIQLTVNNSRTPLPVDGDPARLQQVQVNLLMNAAKYTPEGGKVWYSLAPEGTQAVVRVRDTGVGLSRDMLERVFDLFVQADETLDRAAGGIGVGLTLVRSIVEKHGGTVRAVSDGPGTGSEFVVRLPLAAQPAAVPLPPAGPPPRPAPLSLLLVEDDPDIRESLKNLLEFDGHRVRAVGEAGAALDALAAELPDVAVIDIGIPGLSGYDLAREVRRRFPDAPLRLVALTGYGQASDRAAALAAGFDRHLTKPFRPHEFDRVLAECAAAAGPAGAGR